MQYGEQLELDLGIDFTSVDKNRSDNDATDHPGTAFDTDGDALADAQDDALGDMILHDIAEDAWHAVRS